MRVRRALGGLQGQPSLCPQRQRPRETGANRQAPHENKDFKGDEIMIDTIQSISMRKAKEYLKKKKRQKKTRRNLITGLIFLTALVLLAIFY